MGTREKLIGTGLATVVVLAGGLAVENYFQDKNLLHDGREAAISTINHSLNEEVTLKSGVVVHFGPKHVGGDDQSQDAYKVHNGDEVKVYKPLVSDKYPNMIVVQIPGQEGDLTEKLGWVSIKDRDGNPRTDIEIKKLSDLPESQPVSLDQQGHLTEAGRGVVPDAQVAIAELIRGRE